MRLSLGAAVLVVLLAWLVPSPLPWRSPFEGRSGTAGGHPAGLSAGAAVIADVSGTIPPPASGTAGGASPTPTASPTASAAPSGPARPPTTIPAGFRGTWHGHGDNLLDGRTFGVAVTIRAKPAGSVAATADYPSYGCRETWQLERATARVLTLRATLISGLCISRPLEVQVTLLPHDQVLIRWQLLDSVTESQATLTRVS
jgi:hypothetical protein